jgi:hypothetical protein
MLKGKVCRPDQAADSARPSSCREARA